jgi:hypothetical protein
MTVRDGGEGFGRAASASAFFLSSASTLDAIASNSSSMLWNALGSTSKVTMPESRGASSDDEASV